MLLNRRSLVTHSPYSIRALFVLVLFFSGTIVSGCGLLQLSSEDSNVGTESRGSTSSETSSLEPSDEQLPKRIGIEVTWQVPSEQVDGFVIRYGKSKSSMTNEKKVTTSELSRENDMEFGPVYRFVISDLQDTSPVYVSVAAFKDDRLSDFSEVMQEGSK